MRRSFLRGFPALGRLAHTLRPRQWRPLLPVRDELVTFEIEELEERTLLSGSAPTQEAEPNGTIATATAIGALSGVDLTLAGAISATNDVDLFSVELQAGTQLSAQVSTQGLSSSLDTYLRLFDAAGTQIAFDDDSGPGTNSQLARAISTSGTYYLGVTAYGNSGYNPVTGTGGSGSSTGAYSLIVGTSQPDGNDTIATAIALGSLTEAGATRSGVIDSSNDADLYSLQLTAGTQLSVQVSTQGLSSGLDSFLRVFDATGNEIDSDDDSGISTDAALTRNILTTGTYYLGVSSTGNNDYNVYSGATSVYSSGASAGAYSLIVGLSSVSVDGNDTLSDATALGAVTATGVTQSGAIATEDDVDLYSVVLQVGDLLFVQVSTQGLSSNLEADLRVFNSTGSVVAWESDRGGQYTPAISITVATAGTYYIGVSADSNYGYNPVTGTGNSNGRTTGAYSLFVSVTTPTPPADGDGTLATATPLGTVTSTGVTRSGTIDPNYDFDLYSVALQVGDTLTVGAGFSSYLRIFNSSGNEIGFRFANTGSDLIRTVATAGTYYVGVSAIGNESYNPVTGATGAGSSTGSYSLNVSVSAAATDGNGTIATAVAVGALAETGTTRTSAIESPTDVDLYSVTLQAGVVLKVEQSSLYGVIRVFDSAGSAIAASGGSGLSQAITTTGTYYVGISASGNYSYNPVTGASAPGSGTGTYSIIMAADANATLSSATPLGSANESGVSYSGAIDFANDVDLFSIQLQASTQLSVQVDTPGLTNVLNPYLRVFNSSGTQIAFDNDSGPDGDSALSQFIAAAGTYYLGISSFPHSSYNPVTGAAIFGSSTGAYSLSASAVPVVVVPSIATATLIGQPTTSGTTISGEISASSEVDFYAVPLQAGTNFTAEVRGINGFDSYLRVFNSSGTEIAFDNDAGAGVGSIITASITASGTYYVGVSANPNSTYNAVTGAGTTDGLGTGSYQLVVGAGASEGGATPASASNLGNLTALGVTRTGAVNPFTDVDLYSVDLQLGDVLTVRLSTQGQSGSLDGYLRIYDPASSEVASNDNRVGYDPWISYTAAVSGIHYIGISSAIYYTGFGPATGTTGGYVLHAAIGNDNVWFANAEVLGPLSTSGVTISDALPHSFGVDLYSIDLQAGTFFSAVAATPNSELDARLQLFDASGTLAASNDNSQIGVVDPGLGFEVGVTGTYYLAISQSPNTFASSRSYALSLKAQPRSYSGEVTTAGQRLEYEILIPESGRLIVTLDSTSGVIADLSLSTADGRLLTTALASSTTNDRAIAQFLLPGTYKFAVQGFAQSTGAFELSTQFTASLPPAAPQSQLAGNSPQLPAQGDVNNDGRPDLIIANRDDDTVSVLLGRGDGSFSSQQAYSVGDRPISVVISDFNRDGRLDLAVLNSPETGNGSVSILLGRGDGTFAGQQAFATDRKPSSLTLGDFNGDGRTDLAVTGVSSLNKGVVSILLGQSDGTFAPRQATSVDQVPQAPIVTDFNGDGRGDLALAVGSGFDARAAVILGRSDGTFEEPQFFGAGGDNVSLTVADFNGDGKPDLAVTRNDQQASGDGLETGYSLYNYTPVDNLVVLLGRGDGTFTEQSMDLGGYSLSSTATDLNGDSRIDLLLGSTVLLGQGNGMFSAPDFSIPRSSVDANADGRGDFVVFNGNRIFSFFVGDDYATAVDLNLDGRLDLVFPNAVTDEVSIYMDTGDGTFASANAFRNTLHDPVQFADLNGDGMLDSATVDARGRILVRLGQSSTTVDFGSPLIINQGVFEGETLPAARDLAIISGAIGAARLAVLNKTATSGPNGLTDNVAVYQLDPQGQIDSFVQLTLPTTFTNSAFSSAGSLAGRLTSADLNGDGRNDLVVTNPGLGTVDVLLAGLDGGFNDAHWASYEVGSGPLTVTASHVNGDVFLDLVIANQVSGDLSVLTNDTQGGFTAQRRYDASSALVGFGTDPLALRAAKQASLRTEDVWLADFDGDGEADLLVANSGARSVSLLHGLGDGRFETPRETHVDGSVISLAVGDFNRDGNADAVLLDTEQDRLLIYTTGQSGSLQPLRVAGTGGSLQAVEMPAGNQPTSVQTIDLTGPSGRPDGILDLVVGNEFGDVLLFPGNGDGTFQSFVRSDRSVTLAVTDLDGDGKQDVVTANASLDQVSIGFGTGGGQVATDSLYQRDNGILAPGAIQLQDVTGDGVADLIVANGGGNQVLVFAGLGGGAFGSVQSYFTGTNPVGVTITDLDGVNGSDLVVANHGSNDVSILLNSGATSGAWQGFANGPRLDVGQAPVSTALQDVTGDGVADLVVTNSQGVNSNGTIGNVEVLPGRGGGFFSDLAGDTSFIALPGQTGVQGAVFASPSTGELGAFGYVPLADGRVARFDLGNLSTPSEVLSNFSDVRWIAPFQMGSSLGIAAATRQNVELLVSADGEVFRSLRVLSGGLDPSAMILEQLSSDTLRIYVTEHGEDIVTVLDAQLNENLTSDQSTALAALRAQLAQNPITVSQAGEPGAIATAGLLLRGGIAAVFQLSPTTFAILRVNAPPGQLLERWTAEVRERLTPLLDTLVKSSVSVGDGVTRVLDGVLRIIPVQDRAALTNVVQKAWQILRPVVPNAGQLWEAGRVWIESFTNEPAADGAEQPMSSETQPANAQTRVLEPANHDVTFPLEAGPWRLHALAEQLWNTMRAPATEETRHPITTLATALPHTQAEKNAPTGESEITDGEQWGPPEENLFDGEQFSNVGSLGRRGWTALATIAAAVGYSARSRNIRDKKEEPIAQG